MRARSLRDSCVLLLGLAFATVPARADVVLAASPHLVAVADPPCDLQITPANAATTLYQLNDPTKRVFCVAAGDYRLFGRRDLFVSGTESSPRYLRFDGPGHVKAFDRAQQAYFEAIEVRASWWIVQGLTLQPQRATTTRILHLAGADHVVADGNLIDAIEHPNGPSQDAVVIVGLLGDPATDNTIQQNLIRNGDQSHGAVDFTGVLIAPGFWHAERNDRNAVLDNEIVDWGDGISVAGLAADCNEPAVQHGTVIDGNDVYLTPAKYVDCTTGAANPEGECACAENGIDVKANPGPGATPADWTKVTRNRVWGYRPTTEALTCGGSGALGQAITAGNACPGRVFVGQNIVADSTVGVEVAGDEWIVAGNVIHGIHASDARRYETMALLFGPLARDVSIEWNTIVDALNAYDDPADYTSTRCNAVIQSPEWIGGGRARGLAHATDYNSLYESGHANIIGATNGVYASALESRNRSLCYQRRRWTGIDRVCVPWAAAGSAGPHLAAAANCNASIGAPFGFARMSYMRNAAAASSCGVGAELAPILAALGWRMRQRVRARSPR